MRVAGQAADRVDEQRGGDGAAVQLADARDAEGAVRVRDEGGVVVAASAAVIDGILYTKLKSR